MSKVAFISGGSRGIGRAICLALAKQGYDILCGTREENEFTNSLAEEIRSFNVDFHLFECDFSDSESLENKLKECIKSYPEIDVVVNNAGIHQHCPIAMLKQKDWERMLDINLKASYLITKVFMRPMMKKRSGSFIQMSSVAGVTGDMMMPHYSASKAGLIGFSKAMAKQLAHYQIRVNVVAPGFIDTDMTKDTEEALKSKQSDMIPLKRFGEASEVADLVSFLASDKAKYITGQVIQIDGGLHI